MANAKQNKIMLFNYKNQKQFTITITLVKSMFCTTTTNSRLLFINSHKNYCILTTNNINTPYIRLLHTSGDKLLIIVHKLYKFMYSTG